MVKSNYCNTTYETCDCGLFVSTLKLIMFFSLARINVIALGVNHIISC